MIFGYETINKLNNDCLKLNRIIYSIIDSPKDIGITERSKAVVAALYSRLFDSFRAILILTEKH